VAGLELRAAARDEAVGVEVRRAVELDDPRRNRVGVLLSFLGVLEKLLLDRFRIDPARAVIMAFIAQHADYFGGERLVQKADHLGAVGAVFGGNGAAFDMAARPFTHVLNTGNPVCRRRFCIRCHCINLFAA